MGLVVDLFAGGGGASIGLEAALGIPVNHAVNHDELAITVHKKNHPSTTHYVKDVFEVDPVSVTQGQSVDYLWASPDCFPAGTLILTRNGYSPIEEIVEGQEVLTHRGRWRKVTKAMFAQREIMTVKGYGHPGLRVSGEHPFFIRHRSDEWNNEKRRYQRQLSDPAWVKASEIKRGDFWATPTEFPQEPIPAVGGRGCEINERLLWLAGLYVGDGWSRLDKKRAELVIICGHHEEVERSRELAGSVEGGYRRGPLALRWHSRSCRTATQFSTNHRGLVTWLRENFGHKAEGRFIPPWLLGASESLRDAFLDGYLAADGFYADGIYECSSISRKLIFGLRSLIESLGMSVGVYPARAPSMIEGRIVNVRPSWRMRWRTDRSPKQPRTLQEGGNDWLPVTSVTRDGSMENVYNLSVEEDESYIAEGVVVHNCTHHSIARGGRPRESGIRALAWVVVDWARKVRPQVLFIENVKEFQDWGPLHEGGPMHGKPIKEQKGEIFREWVGALQGMGYRVEWRVLDASHYGAPTKRLRFFLVARCDDRPICWPKPTHGPGLLPLRTAAECIDWSLPCPSIFLSPEEAKRIGVRRPLKPKTMWRIANGIKRYVLEAKQPFIVRLGHYSNVTGEGGTFRGQGVGKPLGTVCAKGNDKALIAPALMKFRGDSVGKDMREPMPTVTSGGGNRDRPAAAPHALGMLTPFIAKINHTGAPEEAAGDRSKSIEDPMSTVCASRREDALIVPTIVTQQHQNAPKGVEEPLPTITTQDNKNTLVQAFIVKHFGGMTGHTPLRPIGAITAKDHHGIAAACLAKFRGTSPDQPGWASAEDPMPTITGGGIHVAEVRAFLTAYYGEGSTGQELTEPMRTITAKARLGLVTIEDVDYQIVDIGMRMLEPHELLLAQFGEFAEHFSFDVGFPVTKAQRIRLIGNSVPPHVVKAIVEANKLPTDAMEVAA